jgi:hypothetical protein
MDKTEREGERERRKKKSERVMLLEAFIEVYSLF